MVITGPRRLRKTNPKPIPPEPPPPPGRLPRTDPATFRPAPELLAYLAHFNRQEYRACVEPVEALFFRQRNTFHQGLLQLAVALLQLQRGMVRGPRRLLLSARELLAPYAPWQDGLAIDPILAHIEAWLRVLPVGVVRLPARELGDRGPAPLRLTLTDPGGQPLTIGEHSTEANRAPAALRSAATGDGRWPSSSPKRRSSNCCP